jgi:hypothetical protein
MLARFTAAVDPGPGCSTTFAARAPLELRDQRAECSLGFTVELVVLVQNAQLLFVLCQDLQDGVDRILVVSHKTRSHSMRSRHGKHLRKW